MKGVNMAGPCSETMPEICNDLYTFCNRLLLYQLEQKTGEKNLALEAGRLDETILILTGDLWQNSFWNSGRINFYTILTFIFWWLKLGRCNETSCVAFLPVGFRFFHRKQYRRSFNQGQ